MATQPWAAGVDESVLRPLVDHWRDGFDWREREDALNQVPQYLAEIRGQRVHFAHLRADPVAAAPVVLTHRWPYSFVEMLRLAHGVMADARRSVRSMSEWGQPHTRAPGPVGRMRVAYPVG